MAEAISRRHSFFRVLLAGILSLTGIAAGPWNSPTAAAQDPASASRLVSLDALARQARGRVTATARIQLAAETSEVFQKLDTLEPPNTGRVPNYLRALAVIPGAVRPFAGVVKSFLYDGAIEPEIKMAMALRMAQINGSPYVAAHLQRFLNGTDRGRVILKQIASESIDRLAPADRLALRYAEWLTRDIHGVSDEDFRTVRGYFNDGQVVELTLTVSFFNYFTRMVEALNLPVERWVLDTLYTPPSKTFKAPMARVNLISDGQLTWAGSVAAPRGASAGQPRSSFGLVNSQRAMMLSPEIASAWRAYTGSTGAGTVDRELKLQVSFAVSMANGCRYCTLHQVQGLRGVGVSMDKLMSMKKDDSALTPRELTAVEFARKLTRDPSSITDSDYQKLRGVFTDRGALEVLMQTCTFAFMNRFTDGLRLPSEDEAVRIYREVYGGDFEIPKRRVP